MLLNTSANALDLGYGGPDGTLAQSITVGSYIIFVACCVTSVTVVLGFGRALYASAQLEQVRC